MRKNNGWPSLATGWDTMRWKTIFSCFLLTALTPSFGKPLPQKLFEIKGINLTFPVDYEQYGTLFGAGTVQYKYRITERRGLRNIMGPGLYPSSLNGLIKDPGFYRWNKKRPANLNPWDYVNTGDPQTEFYAWASAKSVPPGNKLFFTAQALEQAGYLIPALKAYHAVLVHFPKEPCWSADRKFVWYPAGEALSRIEAITKHYPDIGYRLRGAKYKVTNGKDTNLKNDVFLVDPGRWEKRGDKKQSVDLASLRIVKRRGTGRVQLVQYQNKHWQLLRDEEPTLIRGVSYHPTKVGRNLVGKQANIWMFEDENANGRPDAPFDSWVDVNGNGKKDHDEPEVGDFELLQQMGVNAIRLFRLSSSLTYDPSEFNKKLLRGMYKRYGISAIMCDLLGAYTVGSGASWEEGTDYTDPIQLKNMRRLVKAYVLDHKDEPYVLMWILGNENLMPADYSGVNATRTKAATQVKAYLTFVNEIADMIHQLDPDHPVAVGNLGLTNLEDYAKYAPSVDVFGVNSYPGLRGFGDLWKRIQETFDRPVLVTEFGCDAYNSLKKSEDEEGQAEYHKAMWDDIVLNRPGNGEEGNAIGGFVFEFLDEWWKSPYGSMARHDKSQDSAMPFPDGWSSEEWLGLVSQGNGRHSPLLRKPRKAYFLYRDKLWVE